MLVCEYEGMWEDGSADVGFFGRNESMRMFSPVLSGQQRRVELGSGGTMIGP